MSSPTIAHRNAALIIAAQAEITKMSASLPVDRNGDTLAVMVSKSARRTAIQEKIAFTNAQITTLSA